MKRTNYLNAPCGENINAKVQELRFKELFISVILKKHKWKTTRPFQTGSWQHLNNKMLAEELWAPSHGIPVILTPKQVVP